MHYLNIAITTLLMLAVIDQVHEGYVLAEVYKTGGNIEYIHIPSGNIPCSVKEGDKIHLEQSGTVTTISCICGKAFPFKC
jgi:hypothetical protein